MPNKTKTVESIIQESIGQASMCWNPRPSTEVFNSDEALKVSKELLVTIHQLVKEAIDECEFLGLADFKLIVKSFKDRGLLK